LLPWSVHSTLHFPVATLHAQLPCPQSIESGVHMWVQATSSHVGWKPDSVHVVGWQHCAGTQSETFVQEGIGAGVPGGAALLRSVHCTLHFPVARLQ